MSDVNYEMCEPFDVDNGELDGLSPAECFCLDVEWEMVRKEADHDAAFERTIHLRNRERLSALLDRRKRIYTITFMQDDPSENWLWLSVESRGGHLHAD